MDLESYYRLNFSLIQYHKYSLTEIENLIPWERDIYVEMLKAHLEEEKLKQQQANGSNASERLRLAYEYKLGKDLTSKLSDDQIKKLSQYYNSLPPNEQSKVDSDIIKGGGEFLDIALGMMEVEMEGIKNLLQTLRKNLKMI